ncbi:MAG TPA: SDR family oxidoreductase [Solirubrobacterales bacterium]|nr:SDR family oxidoreductase [Solirubrobacterales bacterium]
MGGRSGSKVLVTGGAGFIGSNLVERLVSDGHSVRVLDNFATGHRGNLDAVIDDVELVEGDVQSYERAHRAVKGCDVVFHQAAMPSVPRSVQDPLTSNSVNVIGTLNVLLAARDEEVRRFVFASSSSLYGANKELPKRESMSTLPIAPYPVSKQAAESYCRAFSEVYDMETVCLRYFNVFGPKQDPASFYSAVIPKFATAIASERPLTIHGDGEQSRDFTFIDNVVEANVLSASAPAQVSGQAFNIACGERISLNTLVEELERIAGKKAIVEHVEPRPGDVPHSLADVSLARELLSYEPTIGFREGLERTYEFYGRGPA